MHRRVLLTLLLAVVVAPFAAVRPAAAQVSPEAIAADLNAFWAGEFAAAGLGFSPPGFSAVVGDTATGCGPIDELILGPAGYCLLDRTIYYSPSWLQAFVQFSGDAALFVIISHEWGHHLQILLGGEAAITPETEQQADCLAGAYIASAEARGFAPPGTLQRGTGLSIRAGDPTFLPEGFDQHGAGAYRGVAFMEGYMGGVEACGITL